MYNGTVSFQLDQEWLQEVGGVCEGEDLDRMMAQAIAMETNQQATSNDHLFGIDDRFRREDHYANVVRGGFIQCVLIEFHSRERFIRVCIFTILHWTGGNGSSFSL